MRTRVYVSGPYSSGDVIVNIRNALQVAAELLDLGYVPFVPHLTGFFHLVYHRAYETWLAYDLEWVAVCHAVLRLPGHSPGADRETALAREQGIPVYCSVAELQVDIPPQRED